MIIFVLVQLLFGLGLIFLFKKDDMRPPIVVMIICMVLQLFVGLFGANRYNSVIYNTYLIEKYSKKTSCKHQYQCGQTCTTQNGQTTCQPKYCHEHQYDVDWILKTPIAKIKVDRIDRQGVKMPPLFRDIKPDDYVAVEGNQENSLLLKPDVFATTKEIREKYKVPKYPAIYDEYKFDHIINLTSLDLGDLNEQISNKLKHDPSYKNVIVIFTYDDEYFYDALIEKWQGIRTNDILYIYGLDQSNQLVWFKVNTFADGSGNQKLLTDLSFKNVIKSKEVDRTVTVKDIMNDINAMDSYTKYDNENFKYLKDTVGSSYSIWILIIGLLVQLATSIFIKHQGNRKWKY